MNNLKLSIGVTTDKGNVKKVNQDAFLCKVGSIGENEFGLFVVCDGLGGLEQGEVASRRTIKNFNEWWNQDLKEILKSDDIDNLIKTSLENVITKSNEEIIQYSEMINARLGTTATALFIINKEYYIVHIGDSRVYKVDKKIKKLTEDHTHYEMVRKQGKLKELKNIKKNVLTQCIGVNKDLNIYFNKGKVKNNTTFIVCSDGFYHKMNEKKVCKKLKSKKLEGDSLQEYCEKFVDEVKHNGERDNITLITIKTKLKRVNKFKGFKKFFKHK